MPLSHSRSPRLPQWDSGNYHGPPLASSQGRKREKKTTSSLFFSRWVPGQAVSHCSELTGGVGGDGVGVSLISLALSFYLLRKSWLPLFGRQYKSSGSRARVSSWERNEQIVWGSSSSTQATADFLTWEILWQGSAPMCHSRLMKTHFFVSALIEVEHCWLVNGQHCVRVSRNNGPIISQVLAYKL